MSRCQLYNSVRFDNLRLIRFEPFQAHELNKFDTNVELWSKQMREIKNVSIFVPNLISD